jgi:hypothetical protein
MLSEYKNDLKTITKTLIELKQKKVGVGLNTL